MKTLTFKNLTFKVYNPLLISNFDPFRRAERVFYRMMKHYLNTEA